jgi:hypothetical protein
MKLRLKYTNIQNTSKKHNRDVQWLLKKRSLPGDMEEDKNHTDHENQTRKIARTLQNNAR